MLKFTICRKAYVASDQGLHNLLLIQQFLDISAGSKPGPVFQN